MEVDYFARRSGLNVCSGRDELLTHWDFLAAMEVLSAESLNGSRQRCLEHATRDAWSTLDETRRPTRNTLAAAATPPIENYRPCRPYTSRDFDAWQRATERHGISVAIGAPESGRRRVVVFAPVAARHGEREGPR